MRLQDTANLRQLAEYSLIASVVAGAWDSPWLPGDVFAVCPPACFSLPVPRAIAEELRELAKEGNRTVDLVTLGQALTASRKLEKYGGIRALAGLNFEGYLGEISTMQQAEKLARESKRAQAAQELKKLERDLHVFGACPVDALAERISAIGRDLLDGCRTAPQTLAGQLMEYQRDLDAGKSLAPVPAPWGGLNQILRGGVLPGELAVLAARPSVGKSAFALNWACSVAASGLQSLFFSLEMPKRQLFDRLMANVGGIDVGSFRQGLNGQERVRAHQAVSRLKDKPLIVSDKARCAAGDIRRGIRAAMQNGPVGLVVIDYLQLMTPENRNPSREREVAEITRELKLLAVELQAPILLLAQLNRKSEEAGREPVLSDLRESGAIEQDADIVIFLHAARRAWHPDEPVRVIAAKGRSSGVGVADLIFRRKLQRFDDSDSAAFKQAEKAEARSVEYPDLV